MRNENIMARLIPLISGLLIFINSFTIAEEKTDLFNEGNDLYRKGKYSEAVEVYKRIIGLGGGGCGNLYFNMGNCYYKIDNIGKSILFYERAKLLNHDDKDLEFNLGLANLAVVDKIEPMPEFFLFKIINGFIHLIPKSVLIWICAGIYLVAMLFLMIWIFIRNSFLRVLSLRTSILFFIILIIFSISFFGQIIEEKNREEAIIMSTEVYVMGSPTADGVELFTLHEGTKIRIEKVAGDWYEIVIADGKIGWIPCRDAERI